MEFEQMLRLVEMVSTSGLTEFDYEEGNLKIHLGKKLPKMPQIGKNSGTLNSRELSEDVSASGTNVSEMETETSEKAPNGTAVTSPIVGVFYAAPGPEKEPFVRVGDRVEAGQVIGIVEAMKLMNEIESEYDGVIEEILVKDSECVEYGKPLFRIS